MDGILIVNKPRGITSFDVVRAIRRISGIKKVGHGGTLDPLAEGVLPILLGKATKKADLFLGGDKGYLAEMTLGIVTDSFDADGTVIENNLPVDLNKIDLGRVIEVCSRFTGEIMQVPPMFSAKLYKGERLYKLARAGKVVEVEPKKVTVRKIEVVDISKDHPPRVAFAVYCSKGTYVRSLAHDIGKELGCGAHLSSLVRTYSHPFVLSQALSLESIRDIAKAGKLNEVVVDADELLDALGKGGIDNG